MSEILKLHKQVTSINRLDKTLAILDQTATEIKSGEYTKSPKHSLHFGIMSKSPVLPVLNVFAVEALARSVDIINSIEQRCKPRILEKRRELQNLLNEGFTQLEQEALKAGIASDHIARLKENLGIQNISTKVVEEVKPTEIQEPVKEQKPIETPVEQEDLFDRKKLEEEFKDAPIALKIVEAWLKGTEKKPILNAEVAEYVYAEQINEGGITKIKAASRVSNYMHTMNLEKQLEKFGKRLVKVKSGRYIGYYVIPPLKPDAEEAVPVLDTKSIDDSTLAELKNLEELVATGFMNPSILEEARLRLGIKVEKSDIKKNMPTIDDMLKYCRVRPGSQEYKILMAISQGKTTAEKEDLVFGDKIETGSISRKKANILMHSIISNLNVKARESGNKVKILTGSFEWVS